MSAITTENLVHEYRENFWGKPKRALDGLSINVEEGEIFGYLGANGAGKTTTIKILVGLQKQKSGSATIFGKSVSDPASRNEVGFQPENPYFYEYLSARESMNFYAGLCDVPRSEMKTRVDELLDFVGLKDAADARVKEFSKGMRQRMGIAQALVHKPKLVILDEPMSGLDPVGRAQVRRAILTLKEQGMTVFFSSHVLSDVEMICDRVGLLSNGKLEAFGTVAELVGPMSQGFEVVAENLDAKLLEKLSASQVNKRGEVAMLHFDERSPAENAVREIIASDAKLLKFDESRETLEEFFMRTTGKSRKDVGAWSGGSDK